MENNAEIIFAIPERLLLLKKDKLISKGKCEQVTVEVGDFKIKSLLFRSTYNFAKTLEFLVKRLGRKLPSDAMANIYMDKSEREGRKVLKKLTGRSIPVRQMVHFLAKYNNSLIPLICIKNPDLVEIDVDPPKESRSKWLSTTKDYKDFLERISALTGEYKFKFCCNSDKSRDPYANQADRLVIFGNAGPTGESETRYVGKVMGKDMNDVELRYLCPQPVPGRGDVLKDHDGEEIIQIIGNNIYLLFSCMDVHSSSREDIFWGVVAKAWNFINEKQPDEIKSPPSREEFIKDSGAWLNKSIEDLNEGIKERQEKIDRLRKDLNKELATLAFYNEIKSKMQQTLKEEALPSQGEQFDRIALDPRVDKIEIIEDGIVVTTKLLEVEYSDKKYRLGIYKIRINSFGRLSIWCEKTEHLEDIPHPHIQLGGAVCFGNATVAIEQAAAEKRWADAVVFVLEWLSYGYAPEYALNKIEEWPCLT